MSPPQKIGHAVVPLVLGGILVATLFAPETPGPFDLPWRGFFFSMFFVAFLALLGVDTISRARAKRRVRRLLAQRPQLDSRAFGETYFGESPERARLAGEVREVLAASNNMNLDGLRPDDRLDDDLHAELEDPHLFFGLEDAFGIPVPMRIDEYQRCIESLTTFRDLVDYVQSKQTTAMDPGDAPDADAPQ